MALVDKLPPMVLARHPDIVARAEALQQLFYQKYFQTSAPLPYPSSYYIEVLGRSLQALIYQTVSRNAKGKRWTQVNMRGIWHEVKKDPALPKALKRQLSDIPVALPVLRAWRKWYQDQNSAQFKQQAHGSLWELYKCFDPEGIWAVHMKSFYVMLPASWKKGFHKMMVSHQDCLRFETWCAQQDLSELKAHTNGSLWELYQRFDPNGEFRLHLGAFYSLLPLDWRKAFQRLNASYRDTKLVLEWSGQQTLEHLRPQTQGSLWELYKLFDPHGQHRIHLRNFFSLLPRAWHPHFSLILVSYTDAAAFEKWQKTQSLDSLLQKTDGSTWELYKCFDPIGTRKLNLRFFYSLLSPSWRTHFVPLTVTYNDAVDFEQWCNAQPSPEHMAQQTKGSLWELYKCFDPQGHRQLNLSFFYTLLPKAWKAHFKQIRMSYQDCFAFEQWLQLQNQETLQQETNGSLWALYQRYDPHGIKHLHLGNFHTLLPPAWRHLFPNISATYEDCITMEKWLKTQTLDTLVQQTGGSTWELYKCFDPEGKRRMNLMNFYTLLPVAWRSHFPYLAVRYEDAWAFEQWALQQDLEEVVKHTQGSTWALYQLFDPHGMYAMNQGHFYGLLPAAFKGLFPAIEASYEQCCAFYRWAEQQETEQLYLAAHASLWQLYQCFDPDGRYQLHMSIFYSLLPPAWKPHFPKLNCTYEDYVVFEQWAAQQELSALVQKTGGSTWELYKHYDPQGKRRMNLSSFSTLLPKVWREYFPCLELKYDLCVAFEAWLVTQDPATLADQTEGSLFKLYQCFDPTNSWDISLNHLYPFLPAAWKPYFQSITASYERCVQFEIWINEQNLSTLVAETEGSLWELYQRFDRAGRLRMNLGAFYSRLSPALKEQFPKIDAPYETCVQFEYWAATQSLESLLQETEGSTWELYKRFDPEGKRKLHQHHFYMLLPRAWKRHFLLVHASYENAVRFEDWAQNQDFQSLWEQTDGSLWELYKQFDPTGTYAIPLPDFHSLLSPHWRRQFHALAISHSEAQAFDEWWEHYGLRHNIGKQLERLHHDFERYSYVRIPQRYFKFLLPRRVRDTLLVPSTIMS